MKKAISYCRVSTDRQGQSGLGLEAQQKSVSDFAAANDFKLLNEFIEVESGKRNTRQGLNAALKECKKQRAVLLIATLDRMSRRVAFISALMESEVRFITVDNPNAEEFTLHILAAVAQKYRKDISVKTIAALAASKRRGVELGKYGKHVLSKTNKRQAEEFAWKTMPVIHSIKFRGITTLRGIAKELNRLRIPTYIKGHQWHQNTVFRLVKRLTKIQ